MTKEQKELFDKEVFKWQINDVAYDPQYEIAKHFYELGINQNKNTILNNKNYING